VPFELESIGKITAINGLLIVVEKNQLMTTIVLPDQEVTSFNLLTLII
jgi:hypothetical protein